MRGSGKGLSSSRTPDELEDMVLHQTVGANRIRSHSARHGSHRLARSHGNISTSLSSSSSTSAASIPPSTLSRSTVSSYLDILPSLTLSDTPPPRPPRPPGGLLGISNGRGIGYGRSLGSSYDSPLTIHGSFNGHVRSGANLFGGKNQSSGISPTKSSSGCYRPSLSVFPIQKALEIAMKESRLLQAASSRGGLGPSGSAVQAVRELLDSHPGPSPYCVDEKKRSPLHFAAASGDLELVDFLLERGVRPDCGRDIAGNMPLHLAIISNRIDVVASLLKAGADMTLASPMTHKTPLDLAESRLSYLLSRAQEGIASESASTRSGYIDLFNSNSSRSMHIPPTQSPALLYQIKGIVNLLRPYVLRQQRLQYGERQKDRQKERSWDRADKYMREQIHTTESGSLWQVESRFGEDVREMNRVEDEDEDGMESSADLDGDIDLDQRPYGKRPGRRMDADETEEALESLLNGLSLLESNQRQRQQHHSPDNISDGNLADSEQDPQGGKEVEDSLPDLLEQVQHVLQAIKLNEQ